MNVTIHNSAEINYQPQRAFQHPRLLILVGEHPDVLDGAQITAEEWFAKAEEGDVIKLLAQHHELYPYTSDIRPFLESKQYASASAKEFLDAIVIQSVMWTYP